MARKTVQQCLKSMGLSTGDLASIQGMASEWATEQNTQPGRPHYVAAVESLRDDADEKLSALEKLIQQAIGQQAGPQRPGLQERPISTITSKPIPTDAEKMAMAGNAVRTIGPIVGDLAMTAAAPQLKGPTMAFKAANALLRAGASAAGAGLGAKAGDVLSGDQQDTASTAMAMGAGGELAMAAGGAGVKALGRVAKPVVDFVADLTPLGGRLTAKATKALRSEQRTVMEASSERAAKFLNDIAPEAIKSKTVDMDDLGLKVAAEIDDIRATYAVANTAMKDFAAKNNGVLDMQKTAEMLDGVRNKVNEVVLEGRKNRALFDNRTVKEFGYQPNSPQGQVLKSVMETGGAVPPDEIQFLLAQMNKGWDTISPAQRRAREQLKAALMDDIDDIGAAGGLTAGQVKKEADKAFKAAKQFDFVRRIYQGATREAAETGKSFVQPAKLAKSIYAAKDKVLRDMPDLWPKLQSEADYFRSIAPKFERIEVEGAFDVVTAWGILMPEAKQALSGAVDAARTGWQAAGRPATKAGLQMAGQQINFGGE